MGIFAYNLRQPGQYADHETGTIYNYFRDYDPATGRYRQSDPIGLRGGLNTYSYVSARPLTTIDERGLAGISLDANFSGFLGFGGKATFGLVLGNNICFKVETCGRAGVGANLGMTLNLGYTSGELCTKFDDTGGVFGTGGPFLGGLSSVKSSGSSPSLSVSLGAGPSFGAAVGLEGCRVQYFCISKRPCGCEDKSLPTTNLSDLNIP